VGLPPHHGGAQQRDQEQRGQPERQREERAHQQHQAEAEQDQADALLLLPSGQPLGVRALPDEHPQQGVGHHPGAFQRGQHRERQPHPQHRDAQVIGDAAAHARDQPPAAASPQRRRSGRARDPRGTRGVAALPPSAACHTPMVTRRETPDIRESPWVSGPLQGSPRYRRPRLEQIVKGMSALRPPSSVADTLRDFWRTRPVRPRRGRKLAGVSAAISNRYGIDPLLVRIAFVIAALYCGSGFMLYLLGWLLLPKEGTPETGGRPRPTSVGAAVVLLLMLMPASFSLFSSSGLLGFLLASVTLYLLHRHCAD